MKNIKLSKLSLAISYLIIWTASVASFWLFVKDTDAMGYSITVLMVILPVATFIASFLIGKNDYWGKYKWVTAAIFGFLYMMSEYLTFSMANNIAFNKTNPPEYMMIVLGIMLSLAGIGIGHLSAKNK